MKILYHNFNLFNILLSCLDIMSHNNDDVNYYLNYFTYNLYLKYLKLSQNMY